MGTAAEFIPAGASSSILRAGDDTSRRAELAAFVADLSVAAAALAPTR